MFKAKKEGYLHITLFFSLICGDHGYIFSGNSGYSHSIVVFGSTADQNQVRLDLVITAIVQRADQGVIDCIGPIPYS